MIFPKSVTSSRAVWSRLAPRRAQPYMAAMPELEITEASLQALLKRFYGKARGDDLLGPVFAGAISDWEPHLRSIGEFWCAVMLGTRRYTGDAFSAHARHPLTPVMFERWLQLWGETAQEMFAPEPAAALQERAARIADSLRSGLFSSLPRRTAKPSPDE
jgi:hemoglobin